MASASYYVFSKVMILRNMEQHTLVLIQKGRWQKSGIGGTTFMMWIQYKATQEVLVVKNLHANARDIRDMGSSPGLGRSFGGGHSNSLQCSCLETPMDRGMWWATVHRVPKSCSGLKWLGTHTCKKLPSVQKPLQIQLKIPWPNAFVLFY